MRESSEGRIGRAVLVVALAAATVMLVLAIAALVVLVVQRNFPGEPMHDLGAFHTGRQPPEHAQP